MTTLLIGAGLSGLACAGDLTSPLTVLDKGRAVSGRAATRRVAGAALDHGARFFTARQPRLQALAEAGVSEGWLRVWTCGVAQWANGEIRPAGDGHPRYVPPAGMRELGRRLYGGEVHTEVSVSRLQRQDGHWTAHSTDGRQWHAERVILNLPAPQAAALLGPEAPADLAQIRYAPCWAVGALLEEDLHADFPALQLEHPALAWLCREHTKRGGPPSLMLHATPEWTRAHLSTPAEEVTRLLLAEAGALTQPLRPLQTFAHRWLYAQPETRHPAPFLFDAARGLGLCGDGFTPDAAPSRVEAALLSGWALAGALE